MNGRTGALRAAAVLGFLLALVAAPSAAPSSAAERPSVKLSRDEAGAGGSVTVTGAGWRAGTLLTLLVCGQNGIGGSDSCANADGRTVTTGSGGGFRGELPVVEPPKPCPCVVRVAAVTGDKASADARIDIAGHAVEPLPEERPGGERLSVLSARLTGGEGTLDTLLTWFGAPPRRTLALTVGNVGSAAARKPVFLVGTSHGVFAPGWEEQQWRGTVPAGSTARVELPVELSAGAHGGYLVSLRYGEKVLVEQPWDVGRPWGVTLFWLLLGAVVPAALFRAGMAVVDRLRPRHALRVPGP